MARTKAVAVKNKALSKKAPRKTKLAGTEAVQEKKKRRWHAGTRRMRVMLRLQHRYAMRPVLPRQRIERLMRHTLAATSVHRITSGAAAFLRDVVEAAALALGRDAMKRMDNDKKRITVEPRHIEAAVQQLVQSVPGYLSLPTPSMQ